MSITINKGDYICSDFASFIQGTVTAIGVIGRNIPAYLIETPIGKQEVIIKGQAFLMLTAKEKEEGLSIYRRHD